MKNFGILFHPESTSQGLCRSKGCRTFLLVFLLLTCCCFLVLNYVSTDWMSLLSTWMQQWRPPQDQQSSTIMSSDPMVQSAGSPLVPPTQWTPPGPFDILYPHQYHFVLDQPEKCKDQNPFLVLMVPVGPRDRAARDTIRKTWGNETLVPGVVVRRLFLLGLLEQPADLQQELHAESEEHGDLLQADFLDSYRNLTIKTMLMMEWLSSRCPGASYVAKVDTDMFFNVENLIHNLLDPKADKPKQEYITGVVIYGGIVRRDKNSKWYVPVEVYSKDTYPAYVSGNAYIFSMDLPIKILQASKHVRPIHLEDVYLGMCLENLSIPPTNPPRSNLFHLYRIPYNRCLFDSVVSVNSFNLNELISYWEDFQKPGSRC